MKRRLILALHAGHNASALIGDDDGVRFAIQEERLNREKNFWGFPKAAIAACLEAVGASTRDLECVAYGGRQIVSRYHSRDDVMEAYRRQETIAGKLRQRVAMPLVRKLAPNYRQGTLRRDLEESGLGEVPVRHFDHHLSHAATAYYGLRRDPHESYTVLTCDGSGDGTCATVHVFGGGQPPRELARTQWDHSIGALYSWVTYLLGFVPLEHEYKLMGMAPYASDKAAAEVAQVFASYLRLRPDGLGFEKQQKERTNDLGEQIARDLKHVRFDHVCAGLQRFTEELLVSWAANAVRRTGIPRVLASGGVFMNVKANQLVAAVKEISDFEAFPSCGDETNPFGAYWMEAAERFGQESVKPLPHFYFGDDLDPEATRSAVEKSGYRFEKPDDLPRAAAELLAAGHPLARCAGRMEFGARALGNRSILADPKNSDVVRVINQMVKKRDFWMPFAPVILEEAQEEYIVNPKRLRSPYMMMTFDSKPGTYRDFIAAIHNADLTCRAQLLSKRQNPELCQIVEAFREKSGRSVLLNTSFNLHGFPIVRTAADALEVFKGSGLEHLQVGPYLVHKS